MYLIACRILQCNKTRYFVKCSADTDRIQDKHTGTGVFYEYSGKKAVRYQQLPIFNLPRCLQCFHSKSDIPIPPYLHDYQKCKYSGDHKWLTRKIIFPSSPVIACAWWRQMITTVTNGKLHILYHSAFPSFGHDCKRCEYFSGHKWVPHKKISLSPPVIVSWRQMTTSVTYGKLYAQYHSVIPPFSNDYKNKWLTKRCPSVRRWQCLCRGCKWYLLLLMVSPMHYTTVL